MSSSTPPASLLRQQTYADFWNWFAQHAPQFYAAVKNRDAIETDLFDVVSPRLQQINPGFYILAGMADNETAELIITPEGEIRNIVFAEDIVAAAPAIPGWKFTAMKPSMAHADFNIEMGGYSFGKDNIFFFPVNDARYPDEINITLLHRQYKKEDERPIFNGCCIYLDNWLGELRFATTIDQLQLADGADASAELIPVEKLKAYLEWREKEFEERYEFEIHSTENDEYASFQAELENGLPVIAIMNTSLLKWDRKASHPWMMTVELRYDGDANNGLPGQDLFTLMNEMEDELNDQLKDAEGYLNVGRETGGNEKIIYYACRDFRLPSVVAQQHAEKYADRIQVEYHIFKDKYWKSLERFTNGLD